MKDRIAWIEDDADVFYIVVKPLIDVGFVIETYRSTQDVLDNVDKVRKSSLIILDLLIPSGKEAYESKGDYEGLVLLRTLREKHEIKIPVIIFSTQSSFESFTNIAKDLNVADVLSKIEGPIALKNSVMSILGNNVWKNRHK